MGNVLVTGASSGIGLAACVEAARRGHLVVATMRDPGRAGRLLQAAALAGVVGRVAVAELDVAWPAERVEAAVARAARAHGGLDALVNNAGIAAFGPLESLSDAAVRRVFEVNLFGPLACIRACAPHMRERGSGTIVNVSSMSGRVPSPLGGAYVASKFALEGASEVLRLELGPFGVRVVLVQPGQYRTDIRGRDYGLGALPGSPYEAQLNAWLALEGKAPPDAADPAEVGRLIADILADPSPTLRYPVGPVAGMTAAEWIERHLSRPWEETQRLLGGP